jgi:hypothetical protein
MRMPRFRTGSEVLWLPMGSAIPPRSASAKVPVSMLLVACAIASAVGPWVEWIRASVALALVLLSAACHRLLGRRRRPPSRWLVLDPSGLYRLERDVASMLVDFREPFGLTVFASADRATFWIALTSASATRYLPARIRDAEDAASAPTIIARALTSADGDLRGGDEPALMASDAEKLVLEVSRRAPHALDRAFLSAPCGESVVLDRSELRVGPWRIDLRAPLEWRASMFQEVGARSASLYQATWVRQGEVEVVLVAPAPSDGPTAREPAAVVCAAGEGPLVRRSLARDLRLMRAPAGQPPPRELRRAIDRPFMLPLRRALDGAPRPIRAPRSASRPTAGPA